MVKAAQTKLNELGFKAGRIDGKIGGPNSQTRTAIRAFQGKHNLKVTGELDEKTVQALGIVPTQTTVAN